MTRMEEHVGSGRDDGARVEQLVRTQGDDMAREWSFWTENKLQILGDYLPAFNRASRSVSERIYLDLMAGVPENVARYTGRVVDGSPRRALSADPGFTRHVFFELSEKAPELEGALRREFPRKQFRVVGGDCNKTISAALAELSDVRWAPTFAFVDQQAAEVHWETLKAIAKFKGPAAKTKPEIWLLVSPAMTVRGVHGTNADVFCDAVSRFYGTPSWMHIQNARDRRVISGEQYRAEMTNLIRYRLAEDLGYRYTHRIPMRMNNGGFTIYDMVFATDHDAGDRIMRHLYKQAAEREPAMMAEAQRLAKMERERKSGKLSLFDIPEAEPAITGDILWRPDTHWTPWRRAWWPSDGD